MGQPLVSTHTHTMRALLLVLGAALAFEELPFDTWASVYRTGSHAYATPAVRAARAAIYDATMRAAATNDTSSLAARRVANAFSDWTDEEFLNRPGVGGDDAVGECKECNDFTAPDVECCNAWMDDNRKTCADGSACCNEDDDGSVDGYECPAKPPPPGSKVILVAGDSWGTEGAAAFAAMVKDKLSTPAVPVIVENIAVAGSMASDWSKREYLDGLTEHAKNADYVWITLMGNDCAAYMPGCARRGGSPASCGDTLVKTVTAEMSTILDAVHAANPKARILGFGYDILGFAKDFMCKWEINNMFPQCKKAHPHDDGARIACVNTQFVRLQATWEALAKTYDFVDVIDILGTLQAAAGDANATVGHPDMAAFGPNKLFEANCLHPTPCTRAKCGFPIVFEETYQQYWSKQFPH